MSKTIVAPISGYYLIDGKRVKIVRGQSNRKRQTYRIVEIEGQKAIICDLCDANPSFNKNDIEQRYCARCYHFHEREL